VGCRVIRVVDFRVKVSAWFSRSRNAFSPARRIPESVGRCLCQELQFVLLVLLVSVAALGRPFLRSG